MRHLSRPLPLTGARGIGARIPRPRKGERVRERGVVTLPCLPAWPNAIALPVRAIMGQRASEVAQAVVVCVARREGPMNARPKIPAEAVELYSQYIHGEVSRRDFFDGLKRYAVGGLTVTA